MKFNYFFSETFTNLRRNLLMTVAAISTVAISLLLLGGVQILNRAVNNMTKSWEAQVEIAVFLEDNAQQGEIEDLEEEIVAYPEVDTLTFISQADALEEFKVMYKNQPELWESLRDDALPASLRVKLIDPNMTDEVAARIEGSLGVHEVATGGEFIRTLLRVNSLLRTITFVMSLVLMAAAAALIANTIRLGIYARRDEISIMKLVGATNWFIRIPFMLEGVFAAMVGALISGGVVFLTNVLVFPRVGEAIAFLEPVFSFSTSEMVGILAVLVVVGMIVGIVGSSLALRRFLEV